MRTERKKHIDFFYTNCKTTTQVSSTYRIQYYQYVDGNWDTDLRLRAEQIGNKQLIVLSRCKDNLRA